MREANSEVVIPRWLSLFCFALMGPACGINGVFIALAVPGLNAFGIPGYIAAGMAGAVFGILPARWLASRIAAGIAERPDPDGFPRAKDKGN